MRADFATIGSGLTYEIRNIVEIANFMKSKGLEYWRPCYERGAGARMD